MIAASFAGCATRADMAVAVAKPAATPTELAAIGMALFLMGCARGGETLPESRQVLRELIPQFERELINQWDQLRSVP